MNKMLGSLLIISLSLYTAKCVLGVDLSNLWLSSSYQCIKNSGYDFAIVLGYNGAKGVDTSALQSLANAINAGLTTDIYIFPAIGINATEQVDDIMDTIPDYLYGMIWIKVFKSLAGQNGDSCGFLVEMVNRIKARGKVAGIFSSNNYWKTSMGGLYNCPAVASQPLWFWNAAVSTPTFEAFIPFGGWSKPSLQQYQIITSVCGVVVELNFHP